MADLAVKALAQNINFITRFENDYHNLLELLGKTTVEMLSPGTAYKIYKTSGTLSSGKVGEKQLIPDSDISMKDVEIAEIEYSKYRNLTSIEKIGKQGYEIAVGKTNAKIQKDIVAGIRKTIYAGIEKGTGEAKVPKGKGFQQQVAKAAAFIATKFEDEGHTPVIFANPDDVYTYLGEKPITVEAAFGISYLSNFMGIGNVIMDSNIAQGTVIGTACENLDVVAPNISEIPGMDLTTDETGMVAIHNGAKYENAAIETVAYCGLAVYPTYLDRIVKVTVTA